MKKKKSNESLWFNKSVFYALLVLTLASVTTSCSLILEKSTDVVVPQKQKITFNAEGFNMEHREFVFACDLVYEIYICDRLNKVGDN